MTSLKSVFVLCIGLLFAIVATALPTDVDLDAEAIRHVGPQFPISEIDFPFKLDVPGNATKDKPNPLDLTCNPDGYPRAEKEKYEIGIKEISKWKGTQALAAVHCACLYCTGDAAVLVCNTDANSDAYIGYKDIAKSAKFITKNCPARSDPDVGPNSYLAGIHHEHFKWKTILKLDHHRCP
ncbi:hypothetical protein BJY01DRAFT_248892 [Aspergillus pseudoustus]|uniref:Uncharacterized protein n=1 Tax=Aspergillus pseudoustus TaxID=1810923 RepID=A0ABR4JRU1_9EURO